MDRNHAENRTLAAAPSAERIYVSGIINRAAVTGNILHVERLGNNAAFTPSYDSGYWMVQLDAHGAELDRTGLLPNFRTSESEAAGESFGFYAATLIKRPGIARMELRQNDTVLDSFESGQTPPTVNITSPVAGAHDGTVELSFMVDDPDGDALEIIVEWSRDGGDHWDLISFAKESGMLQIPTQQLGGTNNGLFQITASDGFQRTSAFSELISIAAQPPSPYIGYPRQGEQLLEGRAPTFSGGADDLQDGSLGGSSLQWSSDRDGVLGNNRTLSAALTVGTHVITLEATNSWGQTASTSVTVMVQADYDYDTIPDDVERSLGMDPLSSLDAYTDNDQDGLPFIVEFRRGLDAENPDSDGDGRTDGDELAGGTSPYEADDPLPTDQLQVFPKELNFQIDPSTAALPAQQVLVPYSRVPAGWTLTSDVPWLAASLVQGQTPEPTTIFVDVHLLGDGVHDGNLFFTSETLGQIVSLPVSVEMKNHSSYFDVNRDGSTDERDFDVVASTIGTTDFHSDYSDHWRGDIDRDGEIDLRDLQLIGEVLGIEVRSPLLIAVDFDEPHGASPDGWIRYSGEGGDVLSDLFDEAGLLTGIELSIEPEAPLSYEETVPNAANVPVHYRPLAEVGGNLRLDAPIAFHWRKLQPETEYEIYLFRDGRNACGPGTSRHYSG